MESHLQTLRQNRAVVASAIVAAVAVTVFALVGSAHLLGWIPRQHAAIPSSPPAPAAEKVATAPAIDLLPGESLVEEPPARPDPMFPKYSAPAAPLPAPAATSDARPTGVPRNPYLNPSAPRPATTPPPATAAAAPAPREEPRREEIRPRDERYLAEVRPREERRSMRFCDNCAVVTAVSQYVDEWEVHLRFGDGARRRILYTTPPPVQRGDRVLIENGRLFLDN